MIKLRNFVYIYSDEWIFIVNPPFKNDGGGSYSDGDFNNPHHEFFWKIDQNIEKYLQLKYFLYIYSERNEERQHSKLFLFNVMD